MGAVVDVLRRPLRAVDGFRPNGHGGREHLDPQPKLQSACSILHSHTCPALA